MQENELKTEKQNFLSKIKAFYYRHEKILTPKFLFAAFLFLFMIIFMIYVAAVKIDNTYKAGVVAVEVGYDKLATKYNSKEVIDEQAYKFKYHFNFEVKDIRVKEVRVEAPEGANDFVYYYVYVDYKAVTKAKETINGIYLYKIYLKGTNLKTELVVDILDGSTDVVKSETKSKIKEIIINKKGHKEAVDAIDNNYRESYTFETLKEDMNITKKVNKKRIMQNSELGFKSKTTKTSSANENYSNWFVLN